MRTITPVISQFPQDWPKCSLDIKFESLPPLPAIEDPVVAAEARAQAIDFLTGSQTTALACYEAELRSNRRLEWVGDAELDVIVRLELARKFPKLLTSELNLLRERVVSNETLCYLSRSYQMDSNLSKGASKHYKMVANLFEAHVAGVCSSGEHGWKDMESWVAKFLSVEVIPDLMEMAEIALSQSMVAKGVNGKRKRGLVQGIDTSAKRDKTDSTAPRCPCGETSIDEPIPSDVHAWIDVEWIGEGWHSTLSRNGTLKVCGMGKKRFQSREAAITAYFRLNPNS